MSAWKRDFVSGLIVLGPILVTLFVLYFIYSFVEGLTPEFLIPAELLDHLIENPAVRDQAIEILRVVLSLATLFVVIGIAGFLMRTTIGTVSERILDAGANRLPGIRVVYNASKTASETAFGEQEQLQEPVKLEVWDGLRMTAFKTGRTTTDGKEVIFIPTSPNITTGFLIEVHQSELTELEESTGDALTRVLSAGFGDANDRNSSS
ncbi:DUF502 family protein (plasmid) [Natrialba magadii ATCC 43099]|uniref:DUF502 family protein n=1 Tax=Natrialba magadii (strain ATCC 43099 / DSM 3394 / CCM 3739 / CIP 104546 / IAM 13178 / JCM 8861 / NBRC 102185 / NCIMB 2190 / MS3) TaxID=547559 RepID=D3T1H1_NATMM|nr:DUF502 domain-containing protein [Natrialba magadii]ADD07430.1 DUF502 family protein [Natrialba magadii ATCC 43099]ELY32238.1 hypothetical protein C500_04149 [Natrialba magadii ATCC 43099]